MNGFKNWLLATENVLAQSRKTISQMFPTAPAWVAKDLFHDNWLKKQIKTSAAKGSRTPFTDWQSNPLVQQFKNVTWPEKPACIQVSPMNFCEQTLTDFIVRRFGKKAIKTRAWTAEQDKAKTDTQCDVMNKLPNPCEHVPVIMVQNPDGKYRLLEGWHRMMCRILEGCPEDKKELLYQELGPSQLWESLEFQSWQPVYINAYVGVPAQANANVPRGGGVTGQTPGPADYDSPTGPDQHGTGAYAGQQSVPSGQQNQNTYYAPTGSWHPNNSLAS